MTELLGLIFRWLHIIPALVMVGGVIFMRCCLVSPNSEPRFVSLIRRMKRETLGAAGNGIDVVIAGQRALQRRHESHRIRIEHDL